MRLRSFLLLFLGLAASLAAQSVHWQPAGGNLARGQVSDLVLVFDNCEPDGDINLPSVPNLEFGTPQPGQQSSTSIINGRIEKSAVYYFSYPSRPLDDGPVVIPTFTVNTKQGPMSVAGVRFDIREATVGDTDIPVSAVANSTLKIGNGQVWAGEVVPVAYTLSVSGRFRANIGGLPTWTPAPLVVEEWGEPVQGSEGTGTNTRGLLTYNARGYFAQPGTLAVPSVQQLVNIGVPSTSFFPTFRAEQFAITSNSPQVVVRPLPTPAPATFAGAVGAFKLTSKVVPETAAVGEPVTWTLALEGTGNWPKISALPPREVSKSFRVVQPQATRATVDHKLFDGSIHEDVVLIPTQAGEFNLKPVSWTYFDPQAGRYVTLSTDAATLTITPAAAPPTPAAHPAAPNPGESSSPVPGPGEPQAIRPTPAPVAPTAIPRDPLAGAAQAPKPWSRRQIILADAIVVALLPFWWIWLSWRLARRTDRGRPAREARVRALAHLHALRDAADRPARDRLLIAWQHDVARCWQTVHAAPSAQIFAQDPEWTELWRQSERALYSDAADLPADWIDRAAAATTRKRAPRFPWLSALAPRNLFPVLIVGLALSATLGPRAAAASAAPAAPPLTSYREGKFAAAEQAWRSTLADHPTDWIAHHNLALALAQQNRWDEAGAHAAVAFAQHPSDPSVRWHLTYTLERGGYTPPIFGDFQHPGWQQQVARYASPAEWQRVLLGSLLVAILSLAVVLAHAYGARLRWWKPVAWLIGTLGVLGLIIAALSLQTYGLTAKTNAALTWRATQLRSIPTDLDGEQQAAPLAAGSLALVTKSFLGWRQLSFPNGQTGWVRKEELVGLWQNP